MKQVVKVRMFPDESQAAALAATLATSNEAASWLAAAMYAGRVYAKFDAQKGFYAELKRRFGLSAQPAIRVIGKVAAKQAGVAFVEVDPAYTSQACSACGWVDKHNRRTQAVIECGRCRFVGHADHNAAINIAARGGERWGEVMRPHAAPTLAAS